MKEVSKLFNKIFFFFFRLEDIKFPVYFNISFFISFVKTKRNYYYWNNIRHDFTRFPVPSYRQQTKEVVLYLHFTSAQFPPRPLCARETRIAHRSVPSESFFLMHYISNRWLQSMQSRHSNRDGRDSEIVYRCSFVSTCNSPHFILFLFLFFSSFLLFFFRLRE